MVKLYIKYEMLCKKMYKEIILQTKINLLQQITLVNNVFNKLNIFGQVEIQLNWLHNEIPVIAIFMRYL